MRRIILVLITLLIMLAIKAAYAQDAAAQPYSDVSGDIEGTLRGVSQAGLWTVGLLGVLLAALRVRATHQRQHSGEGGPQQLGLNQIPVHEKGEHPL